MPPAAVPPAATFHFVAIAASAGSLQPLLLVTGALPAGFPAAVLVAHHQSPTYESQMAHLMTRRCPLTIGLGSEGEPVSSGTVTLAPPSSHIVLMPDWRLSVPREAPIRFVRPSADRLFRSLAEVAGPQAIAIVLSGAGTDGAEGARVVKAAGGTVIVQAERTAQFPGMPSAAIRTGAADLVLDVDEIPGALLGLVAQK